MVTAPGQAVIVVHRLAAWGAPSFLVWIDGQRVGKVESWLATEFAVEPGEHTVALSTGWLRSRPAQVSTGPGSRTELMIGSRPSALILKWFLAMLVAAVAVALTIRGLRAGGVVDDPSVGWFVTLSLAIFGGYILLAPVLVSDYWAVWTLEPVTASRARGPDGTEASASAERGGK